MRLRTCNRKLIAANITIKISVSTVGAVQFINENIIEMTELETQIWNTVHNWCDAQSNEIPD